MTQDLAYEDAEALLADIEDLVCFIADAQRRIKGGDLVDLRPMADKSKGIHQRIRDIPPQNARLFLPVLELLSTSYDSLETALRDMAEKTGLTSGPDPLATRTAGEAYGRWASSSRSAPKKTNT